MYRHQTPSLSLRNLPIHTLQAWVPSHKNIKLFDDDKSKATRLSVEAKDRYSIKASGTVETFVSLAVEAPTDFLHRLAPHHILRVDMVIEPSRPLTTYLRLNLRHGPDVDAIPRRLESPSGHCLSEFDLTTTGIGHRPLSHFWVDLIFERPQNATIDVSNINLSLRPRAQF